MNSRALLAGAIVLVAAVVVRGGLQASASPAPRGRVPAPVRQGLPDSPGKDVVIRLCDDCHDLMFTLTSREDRAGWIRVVNDMRSRGTDGSEAEFLQVIEYLTRHMGKPEPEAEAKPEAKPERHAALALIANRTKVAPGEHFALGLRLVPADGWRVKNDRAPGQLPQVSWTTSEGVVVAEPARSVAAEPADLVVIPAVVSKSVEPGSSMQVTARVAYEVCRETCQTETATASLTLPVGEGGVSNHEEAFAQAAGPSAPLH